MPGKWKMEKDDEVKYKKMGIHILCHTNKNKESEKLKIWLKIVEYSNHLFSMAVREVWKKL